MISGSMRDLIANVADETIKLVHLERNLTLAASGPEYVEKLTVLQGQVELAVSGETQRHQPGSFYFKPAGLSAAQN